MKLHIWYVLGPSKSRGMSVLFLVQNSSTLVKSCVVIFCHNLRASTLPWRRHRVNEKLLSTHSNIVWPSNPVIPRKSAEIIHPWVSWSSIIFSTCLDLVSWHVVLTSYLPITVLNVRNGHVSTWEPFPPVLPCGSRFVIITYKCWQLIPSTPPTCNFFQSSDSFSISRRRIVQDVCLFLTPYLISVWNQFHNIPRTWSRSWKHFVLG